jgi:ATP-dependent DNA helicase RecQ
VTGGAGKADILRRCFGYPRFRPGQEEVIDAILAGRDVLAVMPTGAGKSLCYQIPAMLLEGLTLVISPLISLMKDQVNALEAAGISAAFLNSSLDPGEYTETVFRAFRGEYRILYIAPERLQKGFPSRLAEPSSSSPGIALVVIDEAHCVSQWGHDFRPSYLEITAFIRRLKTRPITAAFTATATGRVKDDIRRALSLRDPYSLTTGFDRGNLYFEVQKPRDRFAALLECLSSRRDKSGIIYCSTRKTVEEVCRALDAEGFGVTRYHAGLNDRERRDNQDDFICDRKPVMVATNAFGMGIDKPGVSFVIHYNMPKNIESYYQEAGRAGRNGEKADCILLYSPQDVRINTYLIRNSQDEDDVKDQALVEHNLELLKAMTFYATASDCLRSRLLSYFGESGPAWCGNCSNCNTVYEEADVALEARKIISCVFRLAERGRSFGKTMVTGILRGDKNEKIRASRCDTLSTYGIMADTDPRLIRRITDHLIAEQYLGLEGDEYPVLRLGPRWREIVSEGKILKMMLPKDAPRTHGGAPRERRGPGPEDAEKGKENRKKAPSSGGDPESGGAEDALFLKLRELRNRLAKEAAAPAYIIFPDSSLREMCRKRPLTPGQFLNIRGVGSVKLERYGEGFMAVIREHGEEENGRV